MKSNYTHVTFLLDRSGSMYPLTSDVIGGFKTFVEDQKKVPGECTISISQFDHRYEQVLSFSNIQNVSKIEYTPNGSTALLDAVGTEINNTGKKLAEMREEDRPSKVIFVIYTDGQENSSTEFNLKTVREMVEHQTQKYNWQFVFMGANIDSFAEAAQIGICTFNVSNYANTSVGVTNSYKGLSESVASYRVGTKSSMAFSDEERQTIDSENTGSITSK